MLDLVSDTLQANRPVDIEKETSKNENQVISSGGSSKPDGRMFQFSELAAATMNFKDDHCLGEGAFANVYKGRLECTNQVKLMLIILLESNCVILIRITISPTFYCMYMIILHIEFHSRLLS